MKRLFLSALVFLASACAFAQSNPGLSYGQVPSVQQWNSYFSSKLDYTPGGLPIAYGGTGATNASAALGNLLGSVSSGLFMRGNGSGVVPSLIQTSDVPGIAGGVLGSIPYQSGVNSSVFLAGNTSTIPSFLTSTGSGTVSAAPTYTPSTGSGSVVLSTNPTITGGTITASITGTVNGNTLTAGAGTLTLAGKTLSTANSLALAGTDGTTMTFPSTSASIARIDSSQTILGTQTFNGTLSGTAVTNRFAAPGPIGSTTPSTGAFTDVSSSGNVTGVGFSSYLASPPAIGGTSPSTVKGTTVTASTALAITNLLVSSTAPTLGTCGTGPTISATNGTAAFRVTVGTSPTSSCILNLPTAVNGWNCFASNTTTFTSSPRQSSTSSTTSVTLVNINSSGTPTSLTAADVLVVSCFAF